MTIASILFENSSLRAAALYTCASESGVQSSHQVSVPAMRSSQEPRRSLANLLSGERPSPWDPDDVNVIAHHTASGDPEAVCRA
jgi:hypothetical protein